MTECMSDPLPHIRSHTMFLTGTNPTVPSDTLLSCFRASGDEQRVHLYCEPPLSPLLTQHTTAVWGVELKSLKLQTHPSKGLFLNQEKFTYRKNSHNLRVQTCIVKGTAEQLEQLNTTRPACVKPQWMKMCQCQLEAGDRTRGDDGGAGTSDGVTTHGTCDVNFV